MRSTTIGLVVAIFTVTALAQAQTKLTTDHFSAFSWRSIGPANIGGRVADIAFAPGNAKTYFVGFGCSGLWKTTNMGTTFTPIFDNEVTSSIGSVVVAETAKGKADIVWVGTGEGNGRNSSSWGNGVYRSTDGGASFKNVGLEDSRDIPRLAVDPRNPDICYAAAQGHLWGPNKMRGIYKTEDAGKTWKPALQISDKTGACWVQLDPKDPNTVYAAMYQRLRTPFSFQSGGEEGGLYKSTDAGKTWRKLTNGLPTQTGRIGFDIFAKDPKVIMAVIESDLGGGRNIDDDRSRSGGVFRSADGGENWTRVNALAPRAFYFSKIKIDPEDSNRVYLPGWNILVSDDAGATFRDGFSNKNHVDWHAMIIDPSDTSHLVVGSDGGAYQSFDRGLTWDFMNSMAVGQFYNVAVDNSSPYRIGGGLQDNGSWMAPSSTMLETGSYNGSVNIGITNAAWSVIGGGDGFHVAFDPTNKDIVYSESQGGELGRINLKTNGYRNLKPIPKEGQLGFRFNWNSPFMISAFDATKLYLGGNRLFKLTQRGDNWEAISPDLTTKDPDKMVTTGSNAETHCTIVTLSESTLKPGLLWTGSDDGLVYVTEDEGKTWTNVTPKQVKGRYIAKVDASHSDPKVAYVAVDGHRNDDYDPLVLATKDGGKSWTDITNNLPKGASVRVIKEDLRNPNALYVGTEQGFFLSLDKGGNWMKFHNGGLPTVGVHDIVQHPTELDLVIATHGRSVYVLDDFSPISNAKPGFEKEAAILFDPAPAIPTVRGGLDGIWGDKFFGATNAPLGARFNYWLKDASESVSIEIRDANDKLVNTVSGPGKAGFNRTFWDMRPKSEVALANKGEEPGSIYVPAGTYTVVLKVAGK
jgi:photosystem II stability/assembly factor-like uncharacterized protein